MGEFIVACDMLTMPNADENCHCTCTNVMGSAVVSCDARSVSQSGICNEGACNEVHIIPDTAPGGSYFHIDSYITYKQSIGGRANCYSLLGNPMFDFGEVNRSYLINTDTHRVNFVVDDIPADSVGIYTANCGNNDMSDLSISGECLFKLTDTSSKEMCSNLGTGEWIKETDWDGKLGNQATCLTCSKSYRQLDHICDVPVQYALLDSENKKHLCPLMHNNGMHDDIIIGTQLDGSRLAFEYSSCASASNWWLRCTEDTANNTYHTSIRVTRQPRSQQNGVSRAHGFGTESAICGYASASWKYEDIRIVLPPLPPMPPVPPSTPPPTPPSPPPHRPDVVCVDSCKSSLIGKRVVIKSVTWETYLHTIETQNPFHQCTLIKGNNSIGPYNMFELIDSGNGTFALYNRMADYFLSVRSSDAYSCIKGSAKGSNGTLQEGWTWERFSHTRVNDYDVLWNINWECFILSHTHSYSVSCSPSLPNVFPSNYTETFHTLVEV